MSRKRIDVVELNKKEEKIVLEEKQSPILSFWHNNYLLLLITAFVLSLTILSIGIIIAFKNILPNEEEVIKNVSIDTTLDNYIASVRAGDTAISEETANDNFVKYSSFKGSGEVILVKTIDNDKFTIKYYSDGTATRYSKVVNTYTRIKPLNNGNYGINDNGIINPEAFTSTVTVKEKKDYPWGSVTYYSDGSAEVSNADIDIYVRDSKDINDNYISNNKVSYLKETKKIGTSTLNYYHDGTIEVIKDNKSYLVRNEADLNISADNIAFNNHNEATIYKSKTLADGTVIDYYQDGGAVIHKDGKTMSVRKSNSIVIKNNKIYEIVDNTYVEISNTKNNVTYYTNGGALIDNGNEKYYVHENSLIKYPNGNVPVIPSNKETLSNETTNGDENVKIFEETAIITTKDYINIIPKDKVIYDNSGKVKEITSEVIDNPKEFKIINNTNEKINYRVVIEESKRTTLETQYIRYQLKTNNEYISPSKLKIWENDKIYKALNLDGTYYILLDSTIEPHDTESISIMLWTDYDTIPNAMQNKYFYGTIKVYAWSQEK